MKTVLAFGGAAAVAVLFWFLRGSSDAALLIAKDAQIAAMQETVLQQNGTLDARNALITELQNKLAPIEAEVAKDHVQIDSDKAELQRIKTADETIINSLRADNEADIRTLKSQIQDKDEQIAQLNEKLVQVIAEYENKLNSVSSNLSRNDDDDSEKIYPKDNGFDAQDVGSGFFSYRVFGPAKNPNNVEFPPQDPNQTPWKFGDGNSGIAANGSGYYLAGATNGDSDGAKSTNGQAAALEYAGSWVSQTIKLPAGTFSVSFDYEGRRDYMPANIVAVSLDEKEIFRAAPDSCDHFEHVTTDTITFTKAGDRELKFLACGSVANASAYPTTFIDNVCINVVGTHVHGKKKAGDKAPVSPTGAKPRLPVVQGIDIENQKALSAVQTGSGE